MFRAVITASEIRGMPNIAFIDGEIAFPTSTTIVRMARLADESILAGRLFLSERVGAIDLSRYRNGTRDTIACFSIQGP